MPGRKPIIVLSLLALLAAGLFAIGAVGASGSVPAGQWPKWASPKPVGGEPLTVEDLRLSPGCVLQDATLSFIGGCVVEVSPLDEGFPWLRVTRAANLTAGPQTVGVTVSLAGKTLHTNLDPGENVRLTFTREGGAVTLTCTAVTSCTVRLAEDA
ncbi:MAG: hypothetical protein QM286_09385 [Acidobacteriota bacterium]|nr:hypothetical protein [Acidobacteriota bacterium]